MRVNNKISANVYFANIYYDQKYRTSVTPFGRITHFIVSDANYYEKSCILPIHQLVVLILHK